MTLSDGKMIPDRSVDGKLTEAIPVEIESVIVGARKLLVVKMSHAFTGENLTVAIHQADFIQLAEAIEVIRKTSPDMFVLPPGSEWED